MWISYRRKQGQVSKGESKKKVLRNSNAPKFHSTVPEPIADNVKRFLLAVHFWYRTNRAAGNYWLLRPRWIHCDNRRRRRRLLVP